MNMRRKNEIDLAVVPLRNYDLRLDDGPFLWQLRLCANILISTAREEVCETI